MFDRFQLFWLLLLHILLIRRLLIVLNETLQLQLFNDLSKLLFLYCLTVLIFLLIQAINLGSQVGVLGTSRSYFPDSNLSWNVLLDYAKW